jgi:hypothetical protein
LIGVSFAPLGLANHGRLIVAMARVTMTSMKKIIIMMTSPMTTTMAMRARRAPQSSGARAGNGRCGRTAQT